MLSGLLGDSSVLVVDDDVHADRRRLMLAPFKRNAVARQAEAMAEITAANVAAWPVDSEFAVAPRMSEITLEVILRTVIGASDPTRLAELRRVLPMLINIGPFFVLAVRDAGAAASSPLARGARADRGGRRPAVRRNHRPARRSQPGRAHRRARDAGARYRPRRQHNERPRAARPIDDLAGRRPRHDSDGPVVGAGAATSTRPSWTRPSRRRRPARGDPAGDEYLERWPGKHCASVPWCSTSAASSPSGSSWPDTACPPGSWSSPVSGWCMRARSSTPTGGSRPGPNARRLLEPDHVVPVRRRKPPLPRCHLRHGRDEGGASRVVATRRVLRPPRPPTSDRR